MALVKYKCTLLLLLLLYLCSDQLWLQQSNGSIFLAKFNDGESPPPCSGPAWSDRSERVPTSSFTLQVLMQFDTPTFPTKLTSVSACPTRLWVVDTEGAVHVRGGIAPHCPSGLDWIEENLCQLGLALDYYMTIPFWPKPKSWSSVIVLLGNTFIYRVVCFFFSFFNNGIYIYFSNNWQYQYNTNTITDCHKKSYRGLEKPQRPRGVHLRKHSN